MIVFILFICCYYQRRICDDASKAVLVYGFQRRFPSFFVFNLSVVSQYLHLEKGKSLWKE